MSFWKLYKKTELTSSNGPNSRKSHTKPGTRSKPNYIVRGGQVWNKIWGKICQKVPFQKYRKRLMHMWCQTGFWQNWRVKFASTEGVLRAGWRSFQRHFWRVKTGIQVKYLVQVRSGNTEIGTKLSKNGQNWVCLEGISSKNTPKWDRYKSK